MALNILVFCKVEEGSVAGTTLTDDNTADGKTGSSILSGIVVSIHLSNNNLFIAKISAIIEMNILIFRRAFIDFNEQFITQIWRKKII